MRVKIRTTLRYFSKLKRASDVNGFSTKRVRLTDPSKQLPCGGNGCSPQGFVARMFSQNQLLFIFVDFINQDKARLSEVVSGAHNGIPDFLSLYTVINTASNSALVVGDVFVGNGEVAVQKRFAIG